jgi:hypothetical protein
LRPELPAVDVDLGDLLGGRVLRHVDRLADRATDERLDRGHHLEVAVVVDRARAVGRLEGAVEDLEVLVADVRRALDRLVLVDPGDDLLGLLGLVAEALQRGRHALVDDLQVAAADERLYLMSAMSGSTRSCRSPS